MKVTRCPQKLQCWDYGQCNECETGKAFLKLEKKAKNLEEQLAKLQAENEKLKKEYNI